MEKILVIEDDRSTRKALKELFEPENYLVECAEDGKSGLVAVRDLSPDLVILDLKLPAMSGRDVCREIKKSSPLLPIIILTASSEEIDEVLLLELGADDYVKKPFSPKALLARSRAALRRSQRTPITEEFSFGRVSVDFSKMELARSGQPVSLTSQEFKVLKYFAQNKNRVISREELLNKAWGYNNYPSTRTVDNHILSLRQKIEEDPTKPVHFLTVHNAGYKFVP